MTRRPMRIAYFAHVNGGPGTGVYQKIIGQIGRWRAEGHDARLFLFTRDPRFGDVDSPGEPIIGLHRGPVSRLTVISDVVSQIRQFEPDVVYWRQSLFYPPVLRLPGKAALIIEVQTDDTRELSLSSRFRSAYNRLTRSLMLSRATALVFVTPELCGGRAFTRYRASRYVIANGIDLDGYPELSAPENAQPRLAFVGSPGSPWHGVDKLLALARSRPAWRFDVVGYDAPPGPNLTNVTYHGVLDRAGVLSVLGEADVGVATLALHRISMEQGSTLKMREYLAVGLPVIYAGSDPDVDDIVPHTLRISNTENGVLDDLSRIDEFMRDIPGKRVRRDHVAHLDVEHKEQVRLAMFDEVVAKTAGRSL